VIVGSGLIAVMALMKGWGVEAGGCVRQLASSKA